MNNTSAFNLKYRPDIDGLRALAVLSVVFHHAFKSYFSGGFVGVDIFFVLSGYLITSIIYKEFTTNTFSLFVFWIRRARRIFPAAFVVMLVSTLAFSFIYPPSLFKDLGQSIVAQSFFVSNILFFYESGYFDTSASVKPLLHTWSLSVEEQFYFFFPLLFWAIYRYFRRSLSYFIFIICLLSLVLSVWGSSAYPDAAFYLLPTRVWELGAGSGLAIFHFNNPVISINKMQNNLLGIFGFFAILWSIFYIDQLMAFPSYTAMAPVLGTLALLHSNNTKTAVLNKIFSFKPFVAIGLISYSLYLWHWPVLVFNEYIQFSDASKLSVIIALLISFLLAIGSYFFVEKPFRKNTKVFSNKVILYSWLSSIVFLVLVGLIIHLTNGLPSRNEASKDLGTRLDFSIPKHSKECQDKYDIYPTDFVCKTKNYESFFNDPFLIWGDSHATFMQPAFQNAANILNKRFVFTSYSGCPQVLNVRLTNQTLGHKCKEYNDAVFDYILLNGIKMVYLIFRHNLYVEGFDTVDRSYEKPVLITDFALRLDKNNVDTAYEAFDRNFSYTLNRLKANSINVVVVHQVPNLNVHPLDSLSKSMALGVSTDRIPKRKRYEFQNRSRRVKNYLIKNNVDFIDFTDSFCSKSECMIFKDGKSLYRDTSHIGIYGLELIKPEIIKLIKKYNDH